MRMPAIVEVMDLDTLMSRCVVSGVMPLKYCSHTTLPRWSTMNPSVAVSASICPTVSDFRPEANLRPLRSRSARGSFHTGPSPRAIRAVGMRSRTCWNPHRLNGGSCQFANVTRRSGAGGVPSIRWSSAAVR